MGKGKRKNAITLGILLLAVILLAALYFMLSGKKEEDKKEENSSDSITLSDFKEDDIKEIYYKTSEAEMTLVKEGKQWKQKEDPDFPVNQSHVLEMLSAAKKVAATGVVVNKSNDLGEYGLNSPLRKIRIETKDGKEAAYFLGSEVPYDGGYYLCEEGKDTVYTVSVDLYNAFGYTIGEMVEMEQTPSIDTDKITGVRIEGKKNMELEEKKDSSWVINEPYDSPVTADSGKVSSLLNSFSSFPLIECADYKGDNLKKYGLDNPAHIITVSYEKNKTFHLSVGKKDGKGNYYVKIKDSKRVYTMDEDTVKQMIDLKPSDYAASSANNN